MLIGFGGANWASVSASLSSDSGYNAALSIQGSDNAPLISGVLFCIGLIGLALVLWEVVIILKKRSKIFNIAIEHIALRKRIATPLIDSVNKSVGAAETLPIDLSDCYQNDIVVSPEKALEKTVMFMEDRLSTLSQQTGTKEISIHYGGTPPVGLGFLAGYLIGNTSNVVPWDYNRDDGKWYKLDGYDDSNQPVICWDNYKMNSEVSLLMEISYPVTTEAVGDRLNNGSYVKVSMPEIAHDNMSSMEKLKRFQAEFREVLKKLNADGVKKVHIFCAAQASFNFSLGRQINKNHPTCIIYEYVGGECDDKYPWGVEINSKVRPPAIVR